MLTDAECRNAVCPADKKRVRMNCSGGLYLEVSPNGSKRWFWKFRANGKESRLALGSFPAVGCKAARLARDAAKLQKAEGHNPVQLRKLEKLRNSSGGKTTFEEIALDWYSKQVGEWSPSHAKRVQKQLEKDLFPYFRNRPIEQITGMELLVAIQKIEERGANETADRVLGVARQIWNYWLPIAGSQQRNIAEGLKSRLKPYRKKNFAAITDVGRMGELLRSMRAYKGGPIVRTALLITPILYQRPGNLRMMEWAEIEFEKSIWTIPSKKMKRRIKEKELGDDHSVPLPAQVIKLLKELHPLTGHGKYVFPGERSHDMPISDNTVRSALYSLGFGEEQTCHGFRASARTMLVDELDMDYKVIEANLAHTVKDANGTSYNRTKYIKQRFEMIQKWADFLDEISTSGKVLNFKAA